MKKSISVMALVAASLFLVGIVKVEASGPKIHLEEVVYDFGTVKAGTKVPHEFKFKNLGDADLIITDVKTSCGCTAAVTSDKTLAPGQEGTLMVNFNTSGRSGHQTKTITLVSNDPENPRVMARLTGKIEQEDQPRIQVEPMNMDIGVVEPGKTMTREIHITNTGSADLVLNDFVGRNHVSVKEALKEKQTLKPKGSLTIEVTAAPDNASGIYQGYLQIRSNAPQRVVTVPIYGYVSNEYMLKPEFQSKKRGHTPPKNEE